MQHYHPAPAREQFLIHQPRLAPVAFIFSRNRTRRSHTNRQQTVRRCDFGLVRSLGNHLFIARAVLIVAQIGPALASRNASSPTP